MSGEMSGETIVPVPEQGAQNAGSMKDPGKGRSDASVHEPADGNRYYSPPCFLREIDPAYAGYLTRGELLELLNELLEGERAGAKAAASCSAEESDADVQSALHGVGTDEARFCAMLSRHIRELGGNPSPATGAFYEKLMAMSGLSKRLAFLNRGQDWVVRRLQDILPCVRDDRLHEDLKIMLQVHEANIRRCDRLLDRERAHPAGPD